MTKKQEFKLIAETRISQLEYLVKKMSYRGDSCYDSQKACLVSALDDLRSLINGVDHVDFEPLTEETAH